MKKLSIIIATGLISLAAAAQNPTSEALPFMQLDYNPSSLAMGSTVVPTAALLPFSDIKVAGGVTYQNYLPQISATQYIGGGMAGRFDKIGYSISFVHGTGEKIYVMDAAVDYYVPRDMLLNAGVSYAFVDFMALGVNVKYGKETPWTTSIDGLAADVILAGKVNDIDFAAGVSSIGPKVKSQSSGQTFDLPSAITFGAGYNCKLTEEHAFTIRAKLDSYFTSGLAAGAGVEYCWSGMVSARAGYHYGGESIVPTFASAGLGICYSGITLDAAYLFASDVLGGTFAISAGVRF